MSFSNSFCSAPMPIKSVRGSNVTIMRVPSGIGSDVRSKVTVS